MISLWHLCWIVPVSALCGVFYAALCSAAGNLASQEEEWQEKQKKEKEQQVPDSEIYDACWMEEDKRHCDLLEDDDD
ncbi:MAG: hypothetical protein K6C12_03300 [Oscillospiraceae bacterium]|nr:hypothetical protein [Oscillospiraceae bacterium]